MLSCLLLLFLFVISSQLSSFFFFWFFFSLASKVLFPFVLAFFLFMACSKHVLVKVSVVFKVFVLDKFLLAFFSFFMGSWLFFWIVLSIILLLFWVALSVEFSLQVAKRTWKIYRGFNFSQLFYYQRFCPIFFDISSLRELMQEEFLSVGAFYLLLVHDL